MKRRELLSLGFLVMAGGCLSDGLDVLGGNGSGTTDAEISEILWRELSSGTPGDPAYDIVPEVTLDETEREIIVESAIHLGSACRTPGIESIEYGAEGGTMTVVIYPEDKPGSHCSAAAGLGPYRADIGFEGEAPSSIEVVEKEYDSPTQNFELAVS